MATYTIQVNHISTATPVLCKGPISIYSSVTAYWTVGENPIATMGKCAIISAGETKTLRLPTKCNKLAVVSAETGVVIITEISTGAKASCSA